MLAESLPVTTSISSLVTAGAGVITAVALLITALAVFLPQMRKINKGVEEVHKIVNQQRTDGMNFQRALIRALEDNGIAVPVDQSIGPQGGGE